jgi:hypothetical protein
MYCPAYVAEGEDSVWGDVDAFIEKLESGDFARRYDEMIVYHGQISDQTIRGSCIQQPIPGCV